ncbi:unnamed protein product [Ectocarpus fasciculatus]
MDRRVIFLAEPAPLVGLSFDRRQHDAGEGGSCARTRKVSLDLRHLRGVIGQLSHFCRQQAQAQEHGHGADGSTGGEEGWSVLKAELPARTLKAAGGTPSVRPTTAKEPERDDAAATGSRSGRRVLLAAVFPCPDVPLEATGETSTAAAAAASAEEPEGALCNDRSEQQRQEQESSRLLLALAFAKALEGCGVWLEPADFETRVLAPTRALIDRQIEELGCGQPPADVADATSVVRSRGSATSAVERPTPLSSPSPLGASTSPPAEETVEQADKEAFVRSAADEITFLTRQAVVETVTPSVPLCCRGGGSGGTEADGGPDGRRLCMLDVLWAASSLPADGGGAHETSANDGEERQTATTSAAARTAHQDPHDVALTAASAPASGGMPPPPLTLSEPVDRPCSGPLRSALLETRAHFPRSRITIFPACVQTPGSGEDGGSSNSSSSSSSCSRDENGEEGEATSASSGGGSGLGRRAWQRQWKAWCKSTGARVFLGGGVSAAIEAGLVLDAGLLWRGPVVAGATRRKVSTPAPPSTTTTTMVAAKVAPPTSSGTSSSAANLHNPNPPRPARATPLFPSLDGFALRLAAAAVAPSASGPAEGVHRGVAAGSGLAAAVARGAASTLGRAPALRLARVISPAEVARVCHLLADGDLAPALELFVEDDQRCRGSAEFLKKWAVDGRGLLLVTGAAAAEATGGLRGGRTEAGNGGADEGLAMACFPHYRRRNLRRPREPAGSGGRADVGTVEEDEGRDVAAPVWSVTLFRRASEFSEAAVSALIGESGGDRPIISRFALGGSGSGSVLRRMATGASHESPRLDPVEEKEDTGETATTSSVVASLPVYTSASLISQQSSLFLPPQEASSAKSGSAMTPLPLTPAGASTSSRSSSRKRRRSVAPTVVGGTIPSGSKRPAPGAWALEAEAASWSSPSPRERGVRRRSSRIVGVLAAAEANKQLPELEERSVAAAAEDGRRRKTGESASGKARSVCGGGSGRGAGCRGFPAEGEQAGVKRGCGGRGQKRGLLPGDTRMPGGDAGHEPGSSSLSSLAYTLYGSFGDWGDEEASATVDGGSRRRFWAEECLLPDDGSGGSGVRTLSSSGRAMFPGGSGSHNGNTGAYSKAALTPAIGGAAGVSAGERSEAKSRKRNDGGRGDGENDRGVGGVSGCTAATARASGATGNKSGSGSGGGGGSGAAAAAPPSPPRRTLSTAEEALVNAGQQQRARAKERRVVAREQRARMDRPRPRPRPRGGGVSGSSVSSSSSLPSRAAGAGGGGGSGGNFQRSRGPASGGPSSRSLGTVGRSGSMGSKLSRGSLILGRSVAGGAGVGGASSVTGASGGEGGGGARAGGGAAGGHDIAGVAAPAGIGRQQESTSTAAAVITTRRGEKSIASKTAGPGAGRAGRRGNHLERPHPFASPSSSPSMSPAAVGLAAAAGGGISRRAKRAILQDPPPVAVAPPPASAEPAEQATTERTDGAGDGSIAAGPAHGAVGEGRSRAGGAEFSGVGAGAGVGVGAGASAGAGDATGFPGTAGAGGAGLGNPAFRRVMERAMLAAIASQLGLAEDNPSVLAVFERESRLMGGGGGGGGGEVEELT